LFTSAIAALWWRDVIREAVFEGAHTHKVQTGLKIGFVLFILSVLYTFCTRLPSDRPRAKSSVSFGFTTSGRF
jgi:heme/copper-type cytochrome/quinol oxidase subunit 3